jgi:phage terminase large subunit GpA-like protein
MLVDALLLVALAASQAIQPDPIVNVSEWADQNRVLASKSAAEAGPWRTSRVPFLREIMDALSDHHPAREVVFMKSTQVAGSEGGLNWVGYTIDKAPGPMLVVLPTVEVGDRWSKQRLSSMISESPALAKKIAPARSRDSGNTTSVKEFEGGILLIAGANSAASLSSMPIKKLLLDEVDRYPLEVEDEGDPVDLTEARTSTFQRRKIFKVSSPTIESISRINKDWKRSDQRRYFVPCPHCAEKQVLVFENLRYPEGKPEESRYACEHCGALIDEHHKTAMLAAGEWRATHPDRTAAGTWGYHINALYTPIGLGRRWGEHAKRYEEVRRDPGRLKVWVNTVKGETYEDPNEKLDWEELKERADRSFRLREIPAGYYILTTGVDVQKDRLELQTWGWGPEERGAVVDYHVIDGDPTRPEVWLDLDKYLDLPFRNRFGVDMKTMSIGVDAGYLTDDVLVYTRSRQRRGVFALRGNGEHGRPIIGRASKVDIKRNGVVHKDGGRMWVLGTTGAKHRLFARLSGDRKVDAQTDRMVRFAADLPDDYYMQMSSEVYDPNSRRWVKLHNRRNEALDTGIYAMAAAMHPRVRIHMMRAPQWESWRAMIEPMGRDLFAGEPHNPVSSEAPDTVVADQVSGSAVEGATHNDAAIVVAPAAPVQTSAPAYPSRRRRVRSSGVEI